MFNFHLSWHPLKLFLIVKICESTVVQILPFPTAAESKISWWETLLLSSLHNSSWHWKHQKSVWFLSGHHTKNAPTKVWAAITSGCVLDFCCCEWCKCTLLPALVSFHSVFCNLLRTSSTNCTCICMWSMCILIICVLVILIYCTANDVHVT